MNGGRKGQRRFVVPCSLRYGWNEKTELFGAVPFGVSFFERDNVVAETRDQTGVLGDVTLGFIRQIDTHAADFPDVTITFSVTAPTGSSVFEFPVNNAASLGSGFWQLTPTLNFAKSYDPVVVFGGVGYQYVIASRFRGIEVRPGSALHYYFGLGLAVTDDISLSARLVGSSNDTIVVNGVEIPDSDTEPLACRLSMLRRISLKDRIQTYFQFGFNDDGADSVFGVLLVHDE